MDEKVKKTVKWTAIMIIIGLAVIGLIALINIRQSSIAINTQSYILPSAINMRALTWQNITLTDHSTYDEVNNICYADNLNMSIVINPCSVKAFAPVDLTQYVNFTWTGLLTRNISWIFVYDGTLQNGSLSVGHIESQQVTEEKFVNRWINNYTVSGIDSYSDISPPSSECNFGNTNNTLMYRVGFTNTTIYYRNYCFTTYSIINATAFKISGNYNHLENVTETKNVMVYNDVTNKVEFLGVGLLNDTRSYYRINDVEFSHDESIFTKWVYTPKDYVRRGKWHILGFDATLSLIDAIIQERYIYVDPFWTAQDPTSYYKFENTLDDESGNANTLLPSESNTFTATAKFGTGARQLVSTSRGDNRTGDADFALGTGNFTIALWVNVNDIATNEEFLSTDLNDGGNDEWRLRWITGDKLAWRTADTVIAEISPITDWENNLWQRIVIVREGSGAGLLKVYVNGTLKKTGTDSYDYTVNAFFLGTNINSYGAIDGKVDELSIFKGYAWTPEEVVYDWNNGDGRELENPTAYEITSQLILPADNFITSNTNVTINATLTPTNANVSNWTLFVWYPNSTVYHSHFSGDLNLANDVVVYAKHDDVLYPEGTFNWNVVGCANLGNGSAMCVRDSANRTFAIDLTKPTIWMENVTNLTAFALPVNSSIFFNATDSNRLQTCWYSTSDSATNISVTCNASSQVKWTSGGAKTVYFFANDSVGNENATSKGLTVHWFNVTQYENLDPIAEGSTSKIYLLINSTSPIGNSYAFITWNGTNHVSTSQTAIGTNAVLFSYEFAVTRGMGNATGITYVYNWTYNTTLLTTRSTVPANQTVLSFDIDDCSVYGIVIANFTLNDEETTTPFYVENVTSTHLEIETLTISQSDTTINWTFHQEWTNATQVALCVPFGVLNNSNFTFDITAEYSGGSHVTEFYFLDNGTLVNNQCSFNSYTDCTIDLYDLKTADSTTFLFEFTDEDGLEVEDAIVHTFRKYIGEGIFREVERSREDNNGQTHVHLVEEDVIYYFMITQYGHIIYISNNYNAKCLSTPCEISLTASLGDINWSVIYNEGGQYEIDSNQATRRVRLTYALDSSTLVNLSVYSYNGANITYINGSSLTSMSGYIDVYVPLLNGNNTFFASIFNNNTFVKSEWIDMGSKAKDFFGKTGALLGGIVVLAMMLMAVTEGAGFIVFTILALIVIYVMKLVDLGWLAFISLASAGGVIIYKLVTRGGRR